MFITGDLSIQFKTLSEEQLWIKGHFQTEDQGPKSHLHLASLLEVSSTTVTKSFWKLILPHIRQSLA